MQYEHSFFISTVFDWHFSIILGYRHLVTLYSSRDLGQNNRVTWHCFNHSSQSPSKKILSHFCRHPPIHAHMICYYNTLPLKTGRCVFCTALPFFDWCCIIFLFVQIIVSQHVQRSGLRSWLWWRHFSISLSLFDSNAHTMRRYWAAWGGMPRRYERSIQLLEGLVHFPCSYVYLYIILLQASVSVQETVGGECAGERGKASEWDLCVPCGQGVLYRSGGEWACCSLWRTPATT